MCNMQLVDIKVYLKSEDTLIAKTQIPISSVPILSSIGPSAIAAMQTEETMASGAATPRTTHDGTHKGLGGLECMSMASHSMPGTPRGTGKLGDAHCLRWLGKAGCCSCILFSGCCSV